MPLLWQPGGAQGADGARGEEEPRRGAPAARAQRTEENLCVPQRSPCPSGGQAENVGPAFPEKARKMHYGEVDARSIYGEASLEEARSLLEEGIAAVPLPVLPEDHN